MDGSDRFIEPKTAGVAEGCSYRPSIDNLAKVFVITDSINCLQPNKGNFWHESEVRGFPKIMHKIKCQQAACVRDQRWINSCVSVVVRFLKTLAVFFRARLSQAGFEASN